VISEAHQYGVPAVLIEFSEGLSASALARACDVIAEFVTREGVELAVNPSGGVDEDEERAAAITERIAELGEEDAGYADIDEDVEELAASDRLAVRALLATALARLWRVGDVDEECAQYRRSKALQRALADVPPGKAWVADIWSTTWGKRLDAALLRRGKSVGRHTGSLFETLCMYRIGPALFACGRRRVVDESDLPRVRRADPDPDVVAYYLAGVASVLFEKGDARVCRPAEHGLTPAVLERYSVNPVRGDDLYREDVLRIVEKLAK
jgi:hypothetical protein